MYKLFIAISHCSGSVPLTSVTPSSLDLYRDSPQISCCCSMFRDAVAIVPQDHSLHALQQVTDGTDVRVGQLKVQDVGLGGI